VNGIKRKVTQVNGVRGEVHLGEWCQGGLPKITFLHLYQLVQDGRSHSQNHVGNTLLQSIYKNKSFFFLDQVV
jgi:hypothetical protein